MRELCRKGQNKVNTIDIRRVVLAAISVALGTLLLCNYCAAQDASPDSEPHEMLITRQGFLAIDTPKGFMRSDGPGLAFFIPEASKPGKADVWIYISSAPVGPDAEDKDVNAYIQSDIASFKQRFPDAVVRKETALRLPHANAEVAVYTFESGEAQNGFEQIIYIPENGRALILALSAKNSAALERTRLAFHEFAKSYRGSINLDCQDKTPCNSKN